jgi:hypothetical protein
MPNEREQLSNQLKSFADSVQISNKKRGIVYNVILDENNEYIKGTGIESALIGAIQFRRNSEVTINDESDLPIAYPIDKNFKNLPTKNEVVEIYEFSPKLFGYRRIGVELNPNVNARGTTIESNFKPKVSETKKASEYSKVQKTGIDRKNEDTSNTAGLGEYFFPQGGIHKLKLYEGDTLIESRFGQSIRFSAYNNDEKSFSPTTIIRNGESPFNRTFLQNLPVEEDINGDGSSIVMSSGEYQLNFIPPTETKPNSFSELPTKLVGNQLLLNSDRVIISSKTSEMRFYSKTGFAFATDGEFSMDIKKGMEIFTEEDFTLSSRDKNITFDTGAIGKIFLGTNQNDLEPMVKGNRLIFLLAQLIEILGQAQYKTPSGPTAPGPTSVQKLQTLQRELNSCLSTKNFTV